MTAQGPVKEQQKDGMSHSGGSSSVVPGAEPMQDRPAKLGFDSGRPQCMPLGEGLEVVFEPARS